METSKSKKPQMALYILLIIVGLVFAFGDFIPNEYVKFGVTIVSLCVGFFGAFATIGQSGSTNE